jgi:hypothetical protein
MEIRSSHSSNQRLTASPEGQAQRYQPGQVLEARVLSDPARSTASQGIRVQVGNQILELHNQLAVKTGELLRLRVLSTEPRLELELMQANQRQDSAQSRAELMNSSLKQFIPRQQGLQYLTATLTQALNQPSLPPNIKTSMQQLLASLPRSEALLSSDKLTEVVRSSGLFLEATLAAGRTIPNSDLKLLWLSLLAQLRTHLPPGGHAASLPPDNQKDTPLPFLLNPTAQARVQPSRTPLKHDGLDQLILRLFGLAESAVSRISLNQLATAEAQQQGEMRWKMDLPLIFPNNEFGVLQLFIEKEPPESKAGKAVEEQEETPWSVSLALDMPGLGPLHARLRLRDRTLETRIIAELNETTERLNTHLPQLRERLNQQGLEISCLECHQGQPDQASSDLKFSMLDIEV